METIAPQYIANCPTRQVLDRLADKWTTMVIGVLSRGPMRFSAIPRQIEGISQKMLTQSLRELERDGLLTRTVYAEVPPRVEYELTALGETLIGLMRAITDWAGEHIAEVQAAQSAYDEVGRKSSVVINRS
jgi:DNA-binding HxlR family transcriptional regulator